MFYSHCRYPSTLIPKSSFVKLRKLLATFPCLESTLAYSSYSTDMNCKIWKSLEVIRRMDEGSDSKCRKFMLKAGMRLLSPLPSIRHCGEGNHNNNQSVCAKAIMLSHKAYFVKWHGFDLNLLFPFSDFNLVCTNPKVDVMFPAEISCSK